MKVMRYTGGHVDHRTGPDWPVFVTDSQQSGTSSNKIDLILDMRLLVVNRPLRPRGDRQARPRGPEEVVERWLRTVEPVKQLRQGEGVHAPRYSIRDPAFTGSRGRERRGPASPNADHRTGIADRNRFGFGARSSPSCGRQSQLAPMMAVVLGCPVQDIRATHPCCEVRIPAGGDRHAGGQVGPGGRVSSTDQPVRVSAHTSVQGVQRRDPGADDGPGVVDPVVGSGQGGEHPAPNDRGACRKPGEAAEQWDEGSSDPLSAPHVEQELPVRPLGPRGGRREFCLRDRLEQFREVIADQLQGAARRVGPTPRRCAPRWTDSPFQEG